jgi:membrane protease YdiL (CAAX protease family)
MNEREPSSVPWGIWATIGFSSIIIALFLLIQFLGASVFAVVASKNNPNLNFDEFTASLQTNGFLIASVTCATTITTVGLIALFASFRKGTTVKQYLHLYPVSTKTLCVWIGVALVFAIAWDGLTYLLDRPIIPEFMLRAYETAYFVPLLWLAIVIAAPLAEELFFRGFLFEGIRYARLGATGAVVITSLLWAVIHLQYGPYEITTVFILGLILGVARLVTGSIYIPIVMHALVNLVATVEVAVYIHYFR